MARRAQPEKIQWLREHFHLADPTDATSPEDALGDAPPADDEPARPCRYCPGTMVLTDRTDRPRVSELLRMPWEQFAQARPGPLVTLGPHVAPAPSRSFPSRVLSTSAVTPGEARGP
jgi:hypothetical protein